MSTDCLRRLVTVGSAFAIALLGTARSQRAPVPSTAELKEARTTLKRELSRQLRSRDRDVLRKTAAETLRSADKAAPGSAERFARLEVAITCLANAIDPSGVLRTHRRLTAEFQTSGNPQALTAARALSTRKHAPAIRAACCDTVLELAGAALFAEPPASPRSLLAAARKLAAPLKLKGLDARIKAVATVATAAQRLVAAAGRARKKLATKPDDAAAKHTIARFTFGFAADRNTALRAILANAKPGPAGADELWKLAQSEKDPFVRARLRGEAVRNYRSVADDAPEETRKRVATRCADITLQLWSGRAAWTTEFRKKGPIDPALKTIRAAAGPAGKRTKRKGWHGQLVKGPEVDFVPGRRYVCKLETNLGELRMRLTATENPVHVASFIYLVECGYYDGLGFHRIITDFMAQGGCPLGNGTGHPAYRLDTRTVPNLKFDRPGTLALANEDKPNTEGGQFFITFAPMPHLDGKHTILGHVVGDPDALGKISQRASKQGKPTGKVEILRMRTFVE